VNTLVPADRVFIAGGRGFVGHAVVRRLLSTSVPVSVLTRSPGALPSDLASRVTVVSGDLSDTAVIERALAGCATVVNCARSDAPDPDERRRTDVTGAAGLLAAARQAGIRRFVHLSTISVYPNVADGRIDEATPYDENGDAYSMAKRQMEVDVLARSNDFDVIVLQPSNIYGPGHNWWSGVLLDLMRRGRIILVNGGDGVANLVHVDDVAGAVELATSGRGVSGGRYLLTDGQPRPWREYFEALERILGHRATVSMSSDEAKDYSHRQRNASFAGRAARALVRAVTRQSPIFPLDDDAIDRFASKAVFVIDRARRELGYAPRVDLATGLTLK
jgi:nucleoside-diphosphate-sugar epimerase